MGPPIDPGRPTLVHVSGPGAQDRAAGLAEVAERYAEVALVVVDDAAHPAWVADQDIRRTPTLIGYQGGGEVWRYSGARTPAECEALFRALSSGQRPRGVGRTDLALRVGVGAVLTSFGVVTGAWPLITIGLAALLAGAIPALRRG